MNTNDEKELPFAKVTDRLISMMEEGVAPWRAGYTSVRPTSVHSGKPYSGFNHLRLAVASMDAGHKSNMWMTYKEAVARGGHVRRGEKGTQVVMWREWKPKNEKGKDNEKEEGKETKSRMYPFPWTLFNYDQTEGVELENAYPTLLKVDPTEVHMRAQDFVDAASVCPIKESASTLPCYSPSEDLIRMPSKELWTEGLDRYYNTLFHEMIHSTGHKSRFDRIESSRFGTDPYAREELVAAFGQGILSAEIGLDTAKLEPINAAYLKHWAQNLRGEPGLLVTAVNAAGRASSMLLDRARPMPPPESVDPDKTAELVRQIDAMSVEKGQEVAVS
ncbi:MAG: DUF1738 domain-containing protein [Opitutaceae bacterium]|nr:DUF1738 domain-containing protein [Opitutaceae bacterium]